MAKQIQELDFVVNGKGNAPQFFEESQSGLKRFRDTLNTLRGGGQIAAFGIFAAKFADASRSAIEMAEALEEGRISSGKATEELLKQIPLYGRVWELGRNIKELLFGPDSATAMDRAIKKQEELIKSTERYLDLRQRISRSVEDVEAKLAGKKPTDPDMIWRGGVRAAEDLAKRIKTERDNLKQLKQDIDRLDELRTRFAPKTGSLSASEIAWGTERGKKHPDFDKTVAELNLKRKQVNDLEVQIRRMQVEEQLIGRGVTSGVLTHVGGGLGDLLSKTWDAIKQAGEGMADAAKAREDQERHIADSSKRAVDAVENWWKKLTGSMFGGATREDAWKFMFGWAGAGEKEKAKAARSAFGGLPDTFESKTATGAAQAAMRLDTYAERTAKATEDTKTTVNRLEVFLRQIFTSEGAKTAIGLLTGLPR